MTALPISSCTAQNRILCSRPVRDLDMLASHLETVTLKFRQRLETAGRRIDNVYFIEAGLASVVAVGGPKRREAEIAVIGREGMTGVAVVLGAERSPHETFMQVA